MSDVAWDVNKVHAAHVAHLALPGGVFGVCGVSLDDSHVEVSELGETTCRCCRDIALQLSDVVLRARRNGTAPVRYPGRMLEELQGDGTWRRFDLRTWLREKVGQYTVTFRVREKLKG